MIEMILMIKYIKLIRKIQNNTYRNKINRKLKSDINKCQIYSDIINKIQEIFLS